MAPEEVQLQNFPSRTYNTRPEESQLVSNKKKTGGKVHLLGWFGVKEAAGNDFYVPKKV